MTHFWLGAHTAQPPRLSVLSAEKRNSGGAGRASSGRPSFRSLKFNTTTREIVEEIRLHVLAVSLVWLDVLLSKELHNRALAKEAERKAAVL